MPSLAGEEGGGTVLKRSISWHHYLSRPQDQQYLASGFCFPCSLPQDPHHSMQNGLDTAEAVLAKPLRALKSDGYAASLHYKGFVLKMEPQKINQHLYLFLSMERLRVCL